MLRNLEKILKIVAIVLTLNEARHLPRCLASLASVASEVLVVDSYSTDATPTIAKVNGVRFVQHQFVNHAAQFNWALSLLETDAEWVLRIDADEYLTPELINEIQQRLPDIGPDIDGITFGRRMIFQGKTIRYGGLFPVNVLRLFRHGRGECENRWMDEHIKVAGGVVEFSGELIDDNLNTLTWWVEKHNHYSGREVVDLLNIEYGFMPADSVASLRGGSQAELKRWLKERVYARLPNGFRALVYFAYRYVLRLGFLDGRAGFAFHFLQGFWYRYLVDAKLAEVRRTMKETGCDVICAIDQVLGIKV